MNEWMWIYEGFDPDEERQREALCTLGNGYVATRGALAEVDAGDVHYPGTYLAGVANRLSSEIAGRTVTNESLVNAPNWMVLRCRVPGGEWFGPETAVTEAHHLELDLHRSVLTRRSRLRDATGRILSVTQRRFVSLRDPHLLVIESTWVPENFSGPLEVLSALDGTVINGGVRRYAELPSDHLEHVLTESPDDEMVLLHVRTNDSGIDIVQCARTRCSVAGEPATVTRSTDERERWIGQTVSVQVDQGQELVVEKVVALYTSPRRRHLLAAGRGDTRRSDGRRLRRAAGAPRHLVVTRVEPLSHLARG